MMPSGCRIRTLFAILVCLFALATALPGCGSWQGVGGSGPTELRSVGANISFITSTPTRCYSFEDPNTVDIYMTDLPPEVWQAGADASHLSGVIVHTRLFMKPEAGSTPISREATTAAVRVLVLSSGELGLYGGGGFFYPDSDAGKKRFGGGISAGTLRLTRATAGFADRLGPCTLSGGFEAPLDPAQAKSMDRAFRSLLAYTRRVGETELAPPTP